MQYQNIRKAIFLERPNRFIAHVELGGSVVKVHVKNTGRCRELLVPGAVVYVCLLYTSTLHVRSHPASRNSMGSNP